MDELSKLKGEIREMIKTELDSMGCVGACCGCPARRARRAAPAFWRASPHPPPSISHAHQLSRLCRAPCSTKQDREVSAIIKRQCDEKYGPTWQCIVGEDFKASFTHETKHFMFIASGKQNVLVWKSG